jgi:hypothetical protein
MGAVASVCQPSIFRMLICPEASKAQNSMAAVSAEGSTVCVLIRRLNSSCNRSMALMVLALFHWLGGNRVNANNRSCGEEGCDDQGNTSYKDEERVDARCSQTPHG